MAPVGQTSLHRVQLSWQKPVLKSMTGVQSPSRPPSFSVDGCSTLVGQTLMHWSHLMQRSRNSGSATEPGGRMALWLKLRLFTDLEKRRNGKHNTPTIEANTQRRRGTAGPAISVSGILEMTFFPNSVPAPSLMEPTIFLA